MAQRRQLACVIAAGGTAGHVLPALAVAEALQKRGVRVTFAGSPDRAEARLVPEAGYELDTFRSVGLPRRPGVALLRAFVKVAGAPAACLKILRRRRPDVVLGGGGYVSGPMVLAAGRPVPGRARPVDRVDARRAFELPPEEPVLLVLGGSQGARALNELAVECWAEDGPAVLHLCGERDYEQLRARVARADYRLLPFTDEIGAAYGAADLALARAGGSVWELAAAGLPAVLVPYPHATADHQTKNARYFERAGGAVVVAEAELERVPALVEELLADAGRRERMSAAMRNAARPDAAAEIAEELIALAAA